MELENKKEEILIILKEKGKLPTSKISFLLSRNNYQIESYLIELEKENLIKRIQKEHSTYWELNQ